VSDAELVQVSRTILLGIYTDWMEFSARPPDHLLELEEAFGSGASDAESISSYAHSLFHAGFLSRSIPAFQRLHDLVPPEPRTVYYLACALAGTGKREEALDEINRFLVGHAVQDEGLQELSERIRASVR